MSQKVDFVVIAVCVSLLLVAGAKLVARQHALASLPPVIHEAVDSRFPQAWKSCAQPIGDGHGYALLIREGGETYRVVVTLDAQVTNVQKVRQKSSLAE